MDSKLNNIYSQTSDTHIEVQNIRTNKHSDDIMKWLAAPDPSANLNKAIKARHKGSGKRLLESEAYISWKSGQNSFLWLYGIPGCGKTILTSTIIEDLQNNQGSSQTLLYFYFDFTDSRKQSFENTIRCLVSQMYYQNENAQKHLDTLYLACRGGTDEPRCDSLQKTFSNMSDEIGEIWIVLDALDECTSRTELLSWLRDLAQNSQPQTNIHLLVTSRSEEDIKSSIKRYADNGHIIAIRNDLLEADIRNYVQVRVREHEGLSRWREKPDIQDKIEASLLEKADGM